MTGFIFLKDYSDSWRVDWRVQEWKQVYFCRGPDKKWLWLELEWMEKNVLTEKHSRGNNGKMANGLNVRVDGRAESGMILKFLT